MRVLGGGASCLGVGRPGSGALPLPTARPLGGLPWCCLGVRVRALLGRVGQAGLQGWFGAPHPSSGRSCFALCLFGPLQAGVALFVVVVGFFFVSFPLLRPVAPPLCPALRVFRPRVPSALASCPFPPLSFFFFFIRSPPPSVRPVVSCFACFPAWGALGPASCVPPPPFFFSPAPLPPPVVAGVPCFPVALPVPVFGLALARRPPCGVPFPCAVSCGAVLLCGAVLWCPVFFRCFSPCWWRWVPVVPRWFWAPGRFWVVSVSVLCLCGAVLVCLRRCSLSGAFLPSRGWLVFCVVACCVCVFAVGPGCPPLSPGGSCWLLVSCLGGVLWCVPGCCAAPCCCALCRLALRNCALCCFVLLRLVLPRAVLCPGALSVVLGSCAFWRRVLSCPPALCVFCCGVLPRGVVRRCALCRVRPGVSCRAFPVVSALCGVAVWRALPRCPAPLCCALWCCAAAWCRGVLPCCLVWFVSCVGVVVPT